MNVSFVVVCVCVFLVVCFCVVIVNCCLRVSLESVWVFVCT